MTEQRPNDPIEEDQIDLIALAKKIWSKRKRVVKFTLLFAIAGLLVALLSPVTYTTSSVFIPNSSSDKAPFGLSSLASLAGVDFSSASGSEISPVLYPKILESANFKRQVLDIGLIQDGDSISFKEYILNQPKTIGSIINKYTIGLPGTIMSWFSANEENILPSSEDGEILSISQEEFGHFKYLDEVISIAINDKDRYIELTVTLGDPEIAAIVAKECEKLLQARVIKLKVKQSTELLKYVEARYEEKKADMHAAQNRLSNFKDRNYSISTSSFGNQLTRLEQDYQMASTIFQEVAKQLEQVKLQVSKDTPVFSIIKPVVVPTEKSAPKRALILVIWIFLGLVVTVGYTLIEEPFKEIVKQIKS